VATFITMYRSVCYPRGDERVYSEALAGFG